ncbi:hypothetical protein [Agaribacter marinus]|uniref:Uncharacterized protein n=1 Tax=Agaribacter marinus TaxID=1431249 RepID=A0AA37T1D4_9ALTE|nr:hypothetical protein [Agaribacter marinus]GLR71985.1 hypothetical protein GCM10007852_28930 [Agaribacter marinus]
MKAQESTTEKVSFFDNPKNIKIMMIVFYVLCALLVLLDFVVHRHIYLDFEKIPTFYALYGFVACVVLVVLAKLMRKVVMRDENYYRDRDDLIGTESKDEEHQS